MTPADAVGAAGEAEEGATIGLGLTLVMAVACGLSVANIYYNQPMLGLIQAAFPQSGSLIGLVPTATQVGYALGLLLLIPLGDRFERKRLILTQVGAMAMSLAAAALAPGPTTLVVASIFVGATSSFSEARSVRRAPPSPGAGEGGALCVCPRSFSSGSPWLHTVRAESGTSPPTRHSRVRVPPLKGRF